MDGCGFISLGYSQGVFGDEYNGAKVEDVIAAADYKKGAVIEYDEFVMVFLDLGSGTLRPIRAREE